MQLAHLGHAHPSATGQSVLNLRQGLLSTTLFGLSQYTPAQSPAVLDLSPLPLGGYFKLNAALLVTLVYVGEL